MTCICIDDLRPASFRGAAFFVATDKGEYGRRDVVHEYPNRDDPYVEDLGQKATRFSVTGYLAGDDWKSQKDALVAACTARGPAILQLPTESATMVACLTLSVSRSKDECGFYGVQMEFVKSKNFSAPIAVGMLETLIGGVFNSAIPTLTSFFDVNAVTSNVLSYVVDSQVNRISTFASDIIGMAESAPFIDADLSTDLVQTGISLYQNAVSYAQPGTDKSVYLAQQPAAAAVIGKVATDTSVTPINDSGITVTSGAAAVVPMIAYAINALGNSQSPDDAVNSLATLASWSVDEISYADLQAQANTFSGGPTANPVSASDAANATNASVFCGIVRSFALMKLAQAITAKTFRTRPEAIQARANVVELFNAQIAMFQEDEIVNILLSARDAAVRSISERMTTIVPILTINAPMSKPSLYWAARLYDEATRAEELSDRNDVVNPGFMPSTFEALAR